MNNNILKPNTENKAGRITFYVLEISALAVFCIMFISAIVIAALASSFLSFIQWFIMGTVAALVLYALGRLIDLSYVKAENSFYYEECDCEDHCDCGCEDHEEK